MDLIRELFRYHQWSTLLLLDHCIALLPEQLNGTQPGTYGTIPATFVHLVGTEWWVLSQLGGAPPSPRLERSEALAALREHVLEQGRTWEATLDRLPDLKVTLPAVEGVHPLIREAHTLLLMQSLHHGELHRTEIRAHLGAIGEPVPGRDTTDPWAYWMERHP